MPVDNNMYCYMRLVAGHAGKSTRKAEIHGWMTQLWAVSTRIPYRSRKPESWLRRHCISVNQSSVLGDKQQEPSLLTIVQQRSRAITTMEGTNGFARWLSSCRQYTFREHRLHFFGTLLVLIVFFIFMMAFRINLQWFWLLLYAALILPFAPYVTKPEFFFRSAGMP